MTSASSFFTVSRVCEITGLALPTLKWLEGELGDLLEVRRTSAGNRLFTSRAIDRLREIKRMLDEEDLDINGVRASLAAGSGSPARPGSDAADAEEIAAAARASIPSPGTPAPAADGTEQAEAGNRPEDGTPPHAGTNGHGNAEDAVTEAAETDVDPPGEHDDAGDAADDSLVTQRLNRARIMARVLDGNPDGGHAGRGSPDDAATSLPEGETIDLLLETAEGLVKENLKLRRAVDILADRCLHLEQRMEVSEAAGRKKRWSLFRRD